MNCPLIGICDGIVTILRVSHRGVRTVRCTASRPMTEAERRESRARLQTILGLATSMGVPQYR